MVAPGGAPIAERIAAASADPSRERVAAVVLAAGVSSRMGRPKPLVTLAGRPLLAHVVDSLRRSHVEEIVVVLGAESDRVRRGVDLVGTRAVMSPRYREGMSASIRAGIRAVRPGTEAYLIVLGDEPLVSSDTVNALVARHASTGARIVVPTYRGVRGNPVLLARSLSVEIEAIMGDVGCHEIVQRHAAEVLEVPVEDPGILVDVDTPEDARRVEDALARGTGLEGLVAGRAP